MKDYFPILCRPQAGLSPSLCRGCSPLASALLAGMKQDSDPTQSKEEHVDFWTNEVGRRAAGRAEVSYQEFKFTPACVKSKCDQILTKSKLVNIFIPPTQLKSLTEPDGDCNGVSECSSVCEITCV